MSQEDVDRAVAAILRHGSDVALQATLRILERLPADLVNEWTRQMLSALREREAPAPSRAAPVPAQEPGNPDVLMLLAVNRSQIEREGLRLVIVLMGDPAHIPRRIELLQRIARGLGLGADVQGRTVWVEGSRRPIVFCSALADLGYSSVGDVLVDGTWRRHPNPQLRAEVERMLLQRGALPYELGLARDELAN